jgi:predicted acyltransferase
MAGCLLGTILLPRAGITRHADRIRWALMFAAGLFLAGLVTDTFAGINKIAATPTWCLWSAALMTITWTGLYVIMDVGGFRAWSIIVRPAGANPLIAYLLHPILLWCLYLSGLAMLLRYKALDSPSWCMLGSLVMSLVVCGLTGLIARAGLRVRL